MSAVIRSRYMKVALSFYLTLIIFTGFSCSSPSSGNTEDPDREIFSIAARHIQKGEYEQAASIYGRFIEDHAAHPYVDDAAYRLAYLHVIADQNNPFYDYRKAILFFENFIETYPNSRYINACTNWLHVLNKINPAQAEPVNVSVKENEKLAATTPLQNRLSLLEEENQRLVNKLRELQDALER